MSYRIMNRLCLTIFLSFLFSIQVNNAEEHVEDSLKLQKLSDLAWSLKYSYPDSSFQLAQKALKLAQKGNFQKIEAYSLSDIGSYYRRKGNYHLARNYLNESLMIRKSLSDSTDIASGYNSLGILYTKIEEYDSAQSSFQKGLLWLSNLSRNHSLRTKIYDGFATLHLRQGNFDQAQNYISKAIDKATELNDTSILVKSWQNQGVIYKHIGRSERALEFYNKAEKYYQFKKNNAGLIDIYVNKGGVYLHRRDFIEAIKIILLAKELTIKNGLRDNLSSIYNNLGLAYQGAEQMQLAKEQFTAGIYLADSLKKPQRQIEAVLNLIRLEQERKNNIKVLMLAKQFDYLIYTNGTTQHLSTFYEYYATALGKLGHFEKAYEVKIKADHIKDSLAKVIDNAQLQAVEIERIRKEKELSQQRASLKELSLQQKV